ncbi:chromate transporter [Rhizobium sp. BK313]|uniref:chromate transporter n=1 Tax=Rhizobium sp. BK313 TaxID=2587081 RepID=UPI0010617526|nr:chromate transporter [Rhizobium sp. BK313]MBB3458784.1 chromate transporter [Rhizobium sp. BK313]
MSGNANSRALAIVEGARPSLWRLFAACARVSVSSFGGSVSAMIRVEFVISKQWVTEADFLEGLALAQTLPGVNVVNLSLWLGYSLHGTIGAIIAVLGSVLPPAVIIVAAGAVIHHVSDIPLVTQLLAGVAAAALGFSLNMGIRAARHALTDMVSILISATTIVAVCAHIPLVFIVCGLAPLNIGLAYWKLRRGQR